MYYLYQSEKPSVKVFRKIQQGWNKAVLPESKHFMEVPYDISIKIIWDCFRDKGSRRNGKNIPFSIWKIISDLWLSFPFSHNPVSRAFHEGKSQIRLFAWFFVHHCSTLVLRPVHTIRSQALDFIWYFKSDRVNTFKVALWHSCWISWKLERTTWPLTTGSCEPAFIKFSRGHFTVYDFYLLSRNRFQKILESDDVNALQAR